MLIVPATAILATRTSSSVEWDCPNCSRHIVQATSTFADDAGYDYDDEGNLVCSACSFGFDVFEVVS